jgi:hypothetical protein
MSRSRTIGRAKNGWSAYAFSKPSLTFPGPGSARSYSAYDRKLYALDAGMGGATLTTVDVAAALSGINSRTTTALQRVIPGAPLAMV